MGFFPVGRVGALLSPFRVAEKSDCGASLPNTANDDAQVPMPCWGCGALYIIMPPPIRLFEKDERIRVSGLRGPVFRHKLPLV